MMLGEYEHRVHLPRIDQFAEIRPDGSLRGLQEWIRWYPKEPEMVSLDGTFTVQQLRSILAHINKIMTERRKAK